MASSVFIFPGLFSFDGSGNITIPGTITSNKVLVGAGTSEAPSVALADSPTTGWYQSGTDGWNLSLLNSNLFRFTRDAGAPGMRMGSGMMLAWSSLVDTLASGGIDTYLGRAAAGVVKFGGRLTGVRLNASTDGRIVFQNFAGSDFAVVQGILKTNANAVAETPVPTHTITIQDASGTTYRVPCVI